MDIKKLETLKIHSLTEEQYQKAKREGTLEETAIYLTPDDGSSGSGASSEELEQLQSQVNTLSETVTANKASVDEAIKDLEESSESLSQELADTAGVLEEKVTKNTTDITTTNQSLEELDTEVETVKGDLTSHATSSNSQFALVREEFAAQDAETLKTAKEYSDANKESAVSSANSYTDQKIDELVNGTGLEGVVDTIKDINAAMAESSDMMEALETANSNKVDKGAKGSTIKPIYFDENGAQEIAYTIEKSVPADAKFTDTTYTLIKDATNKKIQLMNGDKLVSEVDDNNTTYTIDGSLSTLSTNPIQNKVVAENINNLQENIDANASEIEEINSKDLFETKHKEGNVIAVSDSAEAPFAGMKLYGNTTQDGTPTPDAPVPLVNVGDNGSFEVDVYGKNLLENLATTTTKNGITLTVNEDGSMAIDGTATATTMFNINTNLKLDGTYILSGCSSEASQEGLEWLFYDGTWQRDSGSGKTFTTSKARAQKCVINIASGKTITNATIYPMIRLATETDSTYEPCNKQTLTMPYTLRSTKNTKDEIDFDNAIVIEKTIKIVFTGSEEMYGQGDYAVFKGTYGLKAGTGISGALSNHLTELSAVQHYYNKEVGFSINNAEDRIRITIGNTTTLDEVKAKLAEWYAEGNPLTIIAEIATPIETPLTENELNAYKKLHTNKSNTTILSEADMEVSYVVDSTSAEYIENRLNEATSLNLYPDIEYKTNNMFYGKTVYVKMFSIGGVPRGTERIIPHEISSLDTIIDTKCMVKIESENIQVNMSSSIINYGNTPVWIYAISSESIKVLNGDVDGETIGNISDCYITLYYTKI